ncbi:hemagglutinin repeat-containing protein [Erwinia billingiae]|uniref:hemagglutinin repeat-containing protein n=1 Tax=Erwinia billingiae TaxID=182337 RepID=UPI003D18283E
MSSQPSAAGICLSVIWRQPALRFFGFAVTSIIANSSRWAGNDALLNASRDINLTSSQDTERSRGTNSSSGGSVGVGVGAGSGGWGINVSASINKGSGDENSDSLAHNETQVSGESIKAELEG